MSSNMANRNLLFHGSGGRRWKISMWAGCVPSDIYKDGVCASPFSSRQPSVFLGFQNISPISAFVSIQYCSSLQALSKPPHFLNGVSIPLPIPRLDKLQLQWPYFPVRSRSEALVTTSIYQGRQQNSSHNNTQQRHLANICKCSVIAKIHSKIHSH